MANSKWPAVITGDFRDSTSRVCAPTTEQKTRTSQCGEESATAVGGALVGAGYVTSDEWTTIAGALAVFVGVVWSVISKRTTNSRDSPPR